jgi:hypothetical protein
VPFTAETRPLVTDTATLPPVLALAPPGVIDAWSSGVVAVRAAGETGPAHGTYGVTELTEWANIAPRPVGAAVRALVVFVDLSAPERMPAPIPKTTQQLATEALTARSYAGILGAFADRGLSTSGLRREISELHAFADRCIELLPETGAWWPATRELVVAAARPATLQVPGAQYKPTPISLTR